MNMLDAIAPHRTRYAKRGHSPCEKCGQDAPLASKGGLGGYFFIACETDGCKQCSEGETLAQVWANWDAGVTV